LSKALRTPIELLRAFDSVPAQWVNPPQGRYLDQIATSFRTEAIDYLNHIRLSRLNSGLDVSCKAREGEAASLIVSEAEEEPNTLITMATHGRSGISRWMMGSVTDKVLHGSSAPLLVVRSLDEGTPVDRARLTSVIAPLDGSPLAEQSLPHVVGLAQALGLTVHLVRVTPHHEPESIDYLRKVGEELRQQGVSSVDERLLHGQPAAAIIDFALEVEANLVVMTTHGRSGIGRWALGSVTDRVVRHCGDPVLVVRAS
jgi:nucleotide-binding universal stress UspA family protein